MNLGFYQNWISSIVAMWMFWIMKISQQSTIKQFQRTEAQKKTPTACSICFPRLVGSVVLAIFLGPFPPRHANGLNELPLRGVIIPGMNDFFKPNDSGTAGTPTILRSFYPPPAGPEPNLNLFLDAKICRFFRIFGTVAVVMSVLGF